MPKGRDYQGIANSVAQGSNFSRSIEERMELVTNQLWEWLNDQGLAWVGFYKISGDKKEMVLVCRQPKPACSPIGLHGVCGKAWREKKTQLVPDVRALGGNHIVCDPANRSEVAVPLIEKDGRCRYVLDLDSRELNAFGPEDVAGLELVLRSAGL